MFWKVDFFFQKLIQWSKTLHKKLYLHIHIHTAIFSKEFQNVQKPLKQRYAKIFIFDFWTITIIFVVLNLQDIRSICCG